MKKICSLLWLAIVTVSCLGQNAGSGKPKILNTGGKTPWPYQHFVGCGMQDKSGNLWFGTSQGVYRYDGKLFANYRVMDGLSVDRVSRMLEDRAGNIWFGTNGGIVRHDPSAATRNGSPSFTSIKIQESARFNPVADLKGNLNSSEPTNPVTQIIEDRNGAIWFCAGFNLYRSDGKSDAAITTCVGNFLKSEKKQFNCEYPDDFGISAIYEDEQGNILISTLACSCGPSVTYSLNGSRTNNPCVLNSCKHDLHNSQDLAAHNKEIAASFTKITAEDGNSKIGFTTVLKDKAGDIWVGSPDNGVFKYDGKHFIQFAKNDNLSKSAVNTIYEDKEGNIWFGTGEKNAARGNGVFRYDGKSVTHFTTKDGLCNTGAFRNDMIFSITEDNTGKLWFGGYGGVCRYDGKSFINLTKKDGFNEQPVNCIVKDKAGNLWIGTWELGLYRYDGKSLTFFTENGSLE